MDLKHLVSIGKTDDAWALLLKRYRAGVHRYCLAAVSDPVRAEQLANDVLLAAHRELNALGGVTAVRTWLFGIADRVLSVEGSPDSASDPPAGAGHS